MKRWNKHLFSAGVAVSADVGFGAGSGPILLDDVWCHGAENSIADCSHDGWGIHGCDHSQDVGVVCGTYTSKCLSIWAAVGGVVMFGEGSGPILLDGVWCHGTEDSIADCRHDGWGIHNCRHREDVGVVCGTYTSQWLSIWKQNAKN